MKQENCQQQSENQLILFTKENGISHEWEKVTGCQKQERKMAEFNGKWKIFQTFFIYFKFKNSISYQM